MPADKHTYWNTGEPYFICTYRHSCLRHYRNREEKVNKTGYGTWYHTSIAIRNFGFWLQPIPFVGEIILGKKNPGMNYLFTTY